MFKKWFDMPGNKKAIIDYHLQKVNNEYRDGYAQLMFGDVYADFHTCVTREVDSLTKGQPVSEPGFVARGLYHQQIRRYLDFFAREQMLFIHNEDLKNYTIDTLDMVCEFLNIEHVEWNQEKLTPVHAISYEQKADAASMAFLKAFYAAENRNLEKFLGKSLHWN
jgi:hypothetical protein